MSSHRWPSSSPSYCCPTSSPPPPPAKATPRRLSRLIGPVQRESERAWVSCQTRRIDTRAGTVCGYCQADEHTHLRCGSRLALRCLCACGSCAVRFRGVLGSLLPHLVLALLLLRVRRRLLLALRRLSLLLALFSSHPCVQFRAGPRTPRLARRRPAAAQVENTGRVPPQKPGPRYRTYLHILRLFSSLNSPVNITLGDFFANSAALCTPPRTRGGRAPWVGAA